MKLIFASHNRYKTQEIAAIFQHEAEIVSLEDIGFFEDIAETGSTLRENALIKARAVYKVTGLPCFADDTGLIVDALNGEPGVHSARYAGPEKNFEANNQKLLARLEQGTQRTARFETVICLIINDKEYFFTGVLNGSIGFEPLGNQGFGYDPIFIPEGSSKTLAQLTMEEKNAISHRALAFAHLLQFIQAKDYLR